MHRFLEARVADYMTRDVVTVEPDATVARLEAVFGERDFNAVPVVDGGRLAGIVTKLDVLQVFVFTTQTLVPQYDELVKRTAGEIMTRDVLTFEPDAPLTRVLQTLVERRVKSFPVVAGDRLVGIIAREDVIRALHDAA